MRFLIDAQLPPALAIAIKNAGHEASHVVELGLLSATDKQIWDRAVKTRSVLVTKDEDFSVLAKRSKRGPCVVWVRIGNTTKDVLEAHFMRVLPEIVRAIESGEAVIEVR